MLMGSDMQYSEDTKRQAIALALTQGLEPASAQIGIPARLIALWQREAWKNQRRANAEALLQQIVERVACDGIECVAAEYKLEIEALEVWIRQTREQLEAKRVQSEANPTYPCPCCGYLCYSDDPHGSFVICPICGWEADNVQGDDPTYAGGANRTSLLVARRNHFVVGASESRYLLFPNRFRREPLPEEIPPGGNPYQGAYLNLVTPFACPCCDHKTFESLPGNTLLICAFCLWTDEDPSQDVPQGSPDWRPSLNQVRLEQARQNYAKWGVYAQKFLPFARSPQREEIG